MQAINSISVAVIPFKKGNQSASVCGDGTHFVAYWDGVHKAFTSLWWAVTFLFENDFNYDWESMKIFSAENFECICRPRGYTYKKIGHSWSFFRDGHIVHVSPTLWKGQFSCLQDCYTKKF